MRRRTLSRLARLGRVTLISSALACALAGPAAALPPLTGENLRNGYHPRCLDADLNTWTQNPGKVQLWGCPPGGALTQHWFGGTTAAEGATVRPIGPPYGPANKCLEAWPDSALHGGYRVSLWDCNGQSQQLWQFIPKGTHTWVLRNVRFNQCLDTHLDWGWDGAHVGLWGCHEGANQQWSALAPPANPAPGGGPGSPAPSPPPASGGPCDPLPVATGMRLTASVGRSRTAVTTSYGRRVLVRGHLESADGDPVADARLCVGVTAPNPTAPVRAVASVQTDSDGAFSYKVHRGSSRRLWFVHHAGGASAAASVVVRVRAPLALRGPGRTLHNGQKMVLQGKLRGGWDSHGLLVQIQARDGRDWKTVGNVRVRRRGGFRWPYRFTNTYRTQVYSLRARLPAQRGYPFVTGASEPVRVRVIGRR